MFLFHCCFAVRCVKKARKNFWAPKLYHNIDAKNAEKKGGIVIFMVKPIFLCYFYSKVPALELSIKRQ